MRQKKHKEAGMMIVVIVVVDEIEIKMRGDESDQREKACNTSVMKAGMNAFFFSTLLVR